MFTTQKNYLLRSLAILREINIRVEIKPFPIPNINDLLQNLGKTTRILTCKVIRFNHGKLSY
jgi:hypothetical protein